MRSRTPAFTRLSGSVCACTLGLGITALGAGCFRSPDNPAVSPGSAPPDASAGPAATPAPSSGQPAPVVAPPPPDAAPDAPDAVSAEPAATAPALRVPPISGGTLAVVAGGRRAVASDSDRDQIYVVDLATGLLTTTIRLQPGDEPGRLVEDADGRVHVALRRGGAVVTLDPAASTTQVLARRSLCPAPRGLAFDKKTGLLHVACVGGELVSINAAPDVTVPARTLMLDRDLRDVVVQGDGLLVSRFRKAEVLVIDGAGKVTSRLTPDAAVMTGGDFGSATFTAAVAWRMVGAPGGGAFLLHQRGSDGVVTTRPGGYGRLNGGCTGIVAHVVTLIDPTSTQAPIVRSGAALEGAAVAADIAVSPDGTQVAIVSIAGSVFGRSLQFFGADAVVEKPAPSQSGFVQECVSAQPAQPPSAGQPTDGGVADPVGLPPPTIYLPPNGEVIAVAFDPGGNVIVQSREPATLQVLTQRRDPIILSTESRADPGHQLFHNATQTLLACASCHAEGGEDGRVWHFDSVGPRRTQSLRGGIMDTAPFHWSGDERTLTDLMTDVFQGRMEGQPLSPGQVQSLSSWLDTIPTITPSAWSTPMAVERGKAIFQKAACTTCHSGPDFTSNQTQDVGTGSPFQVPQLHGLAFRAPYMHDGCAQTLADRFKPGCGGDARHGMTSALTSQELGDLMAYLDTL